MNSILQAPLNSLDSSLSSLITSLQTSPAFASAPAATQSLLSADDSLTAALSLLETHQQNYARILLLRAEATALEEKIKTIVRQAGDFRRQVETIAPGVLEEDSEDEEEQDSILGSLGNSSKYQDVSYTTLLNFARGIGKYNAEAAKEVEQQEQRLRMEAKRKMGTQPGSDGAGVNGIATTTNGIKADIGLSSTDTKEPEAANQILDRAAVWLNQTTEERRVAGNLSFPSGERLRMGILGHLQAVREENGGGDKGEEAVLKEVEKMIAIAEGREIESKKEEEDDEMAGIHGMEHGRGGYHPSQGRGEVKKEEKKTLDLDLWNESDDDDG